MSAFLKLVGLKGAAAIVGWSVAGILFVQLQLAQSSSETFEAQWQREHDRASTAARQVVAANESVAVAAAINRNQAAAIARQNDSIRALRTENERHEAAIRVAREHEQAAQALLDADDLAFRARADRPSASEQYRELRRAVDRL